MIRLLRLAGAAALVLIVLAALPVAAADPGDLDPGFNDSDPGTPAGQSTFVRDGTNEQGWDVTLQPDGKIVVGGACVVTGFDFCALRLNTNGIPDTTFDGDGLAIYDSGGTDTVNGVAIQSGKVLVSGYCPNPGSNFCIVRFNSDGTLDTGFGAGGLATFSVTAGSDTALAMAVQPDDKIVLAGICNSNTQACLARFEADGTIDDNSDSDGGFGPTDAGFVSSAPTATLHAIALQGDGGIVVAGICTGTDQDFCVARYTVDGILDDGYTLTNDVGGDNILDRGLGVALQSDGKVVVSGTCRATTLEYYFCLARYNASDLTLDTTFNSGGPVPGTIRANLGGSFDQGDEIAVQPDDKLVMAGNCGTMCIMRFNADGTIDSPFGTNGGNPGPTAASAGSIALQTDGKIINAGFCCGGGPYDITVARFLALPDSDDDGVQDPDDLCPNSPSETAVDEDGCASSQLDDDGDGVANLFDECPGTPEGTTVSAEGCTDTDGDGVRDTGDDCPNTPLDEPADQGGCSPSQLDDDEPGRERSRNVGGAIGAILSRPDPLPTRSAGAAPTGTLGAPRTGDAGLAAD